MEIHNRIELVIGDLFQLNIGTTTGTANSSPLQKHW